MSITTEWPKRCPGNDSYANGWNKCLVEHFNDFQELMHLRATMGMAEKTVEAMIRRAERAEGYLKACLPYLSDNPDLHQPGAELLADSIKSELKP